MCIYQIYQLFAEESEDSTEIYKTRIPRNAMSKPALCLLISISMKAWYDTYFGNFSS